MNTKTIDLERNEIFDLAFRFVTETNEHIFLTGKAGTGKTTFLKFLNQNCSKNIIISAPTGVAAINAGGVTLHSLFQLPFHPFLPTMANKEELLRKLKFNKQRIQLLRKLELLVIDEISMVRCDTLDAIDTILRSVRRNYEEAFGGIQLLFIGDLFQLPPVAKREEWAMLQEFYSTPFFFDSFVIRDQPPLLLELTTIYRQKENSFVNLLNKVRNNLMDADDFEDLHFRWKPDFRPDFHENYITLTSHNNQADQINNRELHKLLAPVHSYEAIIEDDFPENAYPAEGLLLLKEGAQVMFLKNDVVGKQYFNGKIGVITHLGADEIKVECDGKEITVSREIWENTRYSIDHNDGKLRQDTLGSFTQFPLRLAWAITIHKSQGLTFEKIMIDAGMAFTSGQVYVALSRCTTLEGIVLLSKIPPAALMSNDQVVNGQKALVHKGSLVQRFEGARQVYTLQILEDIFTFQEVTKQVKLLHQSVMQSVDKWNEDGLIWVNQLLLQIENEKVVGEKFMTQVSALMRGQPIIEENEELIGRINAAANHFVPKFQSFLQAVKNMPLISEHKEIASEVSEILNQLYVSIYISGYFLSYGKNAFSLTSFLQHKLALTEPRINISAYAGGKKQTFKDIPNPDLFQQLKTWRDDICDRKNLPIYMVANQNSLIEMATFLPMTSNDLMKISGFGNAKVMQYGSDILSLIKDYSARHQLLSQMDQMGSKKKKAKEEKAPAKIKGETKKISLAHFKSGMSIEEIAIERNMVVSTIENHLAHFVNTGEVELNTLVSPEKQILIQAAIKAYKEKGLKEIKDHLPNEISYFQIKLIMAQL